MNRFRSVLWVIILCSSMHSVLPMDGGAAAGAGGNAAVPDQGLTGFMGMVGQGGLQTAKLFGEMLVAVTKPTANAISTMVEKKRRANRDQIQSLTQEVARLRAAALEQPAGSPEAERLNQLANAKNVDLQKLRGVDGPELLSSAVQISMQTAAEIAKQKAGANDELNRAAVAAESRRQAAVESVRAVLEHLKEGKSLAKLSGAIALAFAGIYAAREGSKVLAAYIQAWIGRPKLVRESSRETLFLRMRKRLMRVAATDSGIENVILAPNKRTLLMEIAKATQQAQRNGDPLMNLLFYGPPGTGKTMFAKALARYSDCDYAIMSGADFSQFEAGDDIVELHKLFNWSKTGARPLIIFVDEAESFLSRRSDHAVSERSKKLTDAFLSQVDGQSSERVMFVFATNIPGVIDAAVIDRVGERVEFTLPGQEERAQIFQLHLRQYTAGKLGLSVANNVDEKITEIAAAMEGFSGRTIAGIVLKAIRTARVNQSGVLTLDSVMSAIAREREAIQKAEIAQQYV